MPIYRSKTTTAGRALWCATGMKYDDFQKPIIAVVNSFTQFVPGHVHLNLKTSVEPYCERLTLEIKAFFTKIRLTVVVTTAFTKFWQKML